MHELVFGGDKRIMHIDWVSTHYESGDLPCLFERWVAPLWHAP